MFNKYFTQILIWFIPLFLLTSGVSALEEEDSISLTLEECILRALEHNLNIKIEVMNPEISALSVARAKEKFLPELSFSFDKRNTESASYSFLDAADQVETQYQSFSAAVSQFLPSGGTLSFSLENAENETNRNFQTINPRFDSTLRVTFNQPLLKNFGLSINRKEIIVAKNNRDISRSRFKSVLMETVYSVEEAYWNLVYSIENLKVQQQSLNLAQELLAKNKRSVEIGTMAPIEIKSAAAEVATREADILQAEALVKNNEDRLRTIINFNAGMGSRYVKINPVDEPVFTEPVIDLKQSIETAIDNRPDLEQTRIDLKNKQIELRYAKNQLLPDLNLQASYWSPGLSGTQILYQDDNPLSGVVVGTVPGLAADALKDAFRFLYPNWSVGLNLNIPLSTFFSRSQVALAKVNLEQSQLRLQNDMQQVLLDIKNAVRNVQTNYKRAQAYKLARELTQEKLKAEEEKLRVGKSTNYNVLLYQRDLVSAQSNELKAIVDANLSRAYLQKALGISLKEKNITLKK